MPHTIGKRSPSCSHERSQSKQLPEPLHTEPAPQPVPMRHWHSTVLLHSPGSVHSTHSSATLQTLQSTIHLRLTAHAPHHHQHLCLTFQTLLARSLLPTLQTEIAHKRTCPAKHSSCRPCSPCTAPWTPQQLTWRSRL